tara:strand:+ start:60774 stop:61715 length:942 start_codon:yes stop_codon:yes gene_type:complete
MNTAKIISFVENPALLATVEIDVLEKIITAYPYFSIARILLTKKMQQEQHLLFKKEIKKTAVSIPFGKNLYEFLYQKEIQKTIIESQEIEEPLEKLPETTVVTAKEVPPSTTEDNHSSFTQPVEIKPSSVRKTRFSKPIDLKDFGTEKASEMDILEQQIIGQTIEHVLSAEIEAQHQLVQKNPLPETEMISSSQKFSDWLTILDQDRLKTWRTPVTENEVKTPSESDIIDSFLQKDINIITPTNEDTTYSPTNLARLSVVDDEDFVTETLADIYAKQGNLLKALAAYNKLLLKYPEKKTYFAARIEKIEKDLK